MSIYNTYVDFVGDGTTTDFSIPFPYIDPSDVVVSVGGSVIADTLYTFPSPGVVRITSAPASSAAIHIERATTISDPRVVFTNGSSTTSEQLNTMVIQLLFAMQEAVDRASVGQSDASTALATANTAKSEADTALANANSASTTATAANTAAANAVTAAAAATTTANAAAAAASVHDALTLPYDNASSGLAATNVQDAVDLIAGASGIGTLTSSSVNNASTVTGAKITDALNALKAMITALATVASSGDYADLTGKPALATVATSGAYADLSGTPSLGAAAPKNLAAAAAIRANSSTDISTVDQEWAAAAWVDLGDITGAVTLNCSNGFRFKGKLVGNVTFSLTNGKSGQPLDILLLQDATGGRTVSWSGANFAFANNTAPTVSTGPNGDALFASGICTTATGAYMTGWKFA